MGHQLQHHPQGDDRYAGQQLHSVMIMGLAFIVMKSFILIYLPDNDKEAPSRPKPIKDT